MTTLEDFPEGIREFVEVILEEVHGDADRAYKGLNITLPNMIQWIWDNVPTPLKPGPYIYSIDGDPGFEELVVVIGRHGAEGEHTYISDGWESAFAYAHELTAADEWPEWWPEALRGES